MKFTRIYMISCLMFIGAFASSPPENSSPDLDISKDKIEEEETHKETLEDLEDELASAEENLPILPPIILIDFTNGTNLTSEEKSKRTINGNLGYGFQSNNLFSGKYNYYFPAGKTGTTVSIEESISPFLPRTIIEKVNPVPEKSYINPSGNTYSSSIENNNFFGGSSSGRAQVQSSGINSPASYVFGQRTKLQKINNDNFRSFSSLSTTPKPNYAPYSTPKPDFQSNRFSAGLGSFGNQNFATFTTPRTPIYNAPLQAQYQQPGSNLNTYDSLLQKYKGYQPAGLPSNFGAQSPQLNFGSSGNRGPALESYTTPSPRNYPTQSQTTVLSAVGNGPKYSIENGIKYEHKIVWKYPNGMVSETGPNSYNSYSDYTSPTKTSLISNYQNSGAANNFPRTINSGYSAGSIYSQKPATFPDDGPSDDENSKANQFVSSASISNTASGFSGSDSRPMYPSQKYSYQTPYSLQSGNSKSQSIKTQSTLSPFSSSSSSYTGNLNTYSLDDPKALSNYPIDSSEAEYPSVQSFTSGEIAGGPDSPQASAYTYSQTSPVSGSYRQATSSNVRSGSGKISASILSRYTPQVQQYLKKALGLGESGKSQEYTQSKQPSTDLYSNVKYSNLLDYNPSISQYISNPSSLLNAQPTFIQAGNSLIPVIILRVDGVPPIQPKVTPNINLKALLQKYLTQYAQTVNNLSQGGENYDQSYGAAKGGLSSSDSDLFDLNQLTQNLGQLNQDPSFKQNFAQNFVQSIAQSAQSYQPSSFSSQINYDDYKNQNSDGHSQKYLSSSSLDVTKKPKVKNVQIIDDPRFTTYKIKN